MEFNITTTGVNVTLNDIGVELVHPQTTDLLLEIGISDILDSQELDSALETGLLVASDENGDPILVSSFTKLSRKTDLINSENILNSLQQGDYITIDNTDSKNPIINSNVLPKDTNPTVNLSPTAQEGDIAYDTTTKEFQVFDGTEFKNPALSETQEAQTTSVAAGSTLGLEQSLLANAGQPGLTVLAVGFTNTGKVQGISLGDGNVVEVYASGADFTSGTVLYREFMSLGEVICFTGLSNGAIIQASQGFYGFSEQVNGGDESPMPLLSYGLSFKSTFFFAFRNCQTYDPEGTSTNQGWIHVVNGAITSTIELTTGAGAVVQGQTGIKLKPWEYVRLYTSGNQEYIINSDNPIMACHSANMDSNPTGRFYDSRLIMPLTNDGITWPRSGQVSAPYNNTIVNWYTRDNAEGSLNSGNGVSPGTPIDFDASPPLGTGANDQDYEPNGATRVLAIGLVSAYSGADSAGLEASPLMPTSAMSQVVAQPLFIADTGDGGDSGVAIASPYEGTAKVYEWNDTTKTIDLAYTVVFTRNGVTVTSKEDQYHPAAGLISNDAQASNTLVGQLNPGVIISDVPITVVVQNGTPTLTPTIRSQNGTTTTAIVTQDDETLTLGWTPTTIKAEITEGEDGILYKRVIPSGGGTDNWVVA